MDLFLQTAINGLAVSLIYVFVGTSVTIISGVSRLDRLLAGVGVGAGVVRVLRGRRGGAPLPVIILVGPAHRCDLGLRAASPGAGTPHG